MLRSDQIRAAVHTAAADAERFLCGLIRFPSTPGAEQEAMEYLAARFAGLAEVERVPLANNLRDDPEYSGLIPGIDYTGRCNLRLRVPGAGVGRSLLLNTHVDVVPASDGHQRPFDPRVEGGRVIGRGACDAKGQVAAIYAALAALRSLGIKLAGDVLVHLVVEEEVGGNGTAAMVRRGERADACIVMEPTALQVMTATRGAVWFRVRCTGKSIHGGRATEGVSALDSAVRVIELLKNYHARLLGASRGIPLFDRYPNPMPVLVGKLEAGNWPSMAPASAVLEGMLGFLPNRTREQVMEEIRQAILDGADPWLREHFTLEFLYRHDCHVLPAGHPLGEGLLACAREAGAAAEISAMTASCDACFYHNQLGIPTVVFGPGDLRFAHAPDEQIALEDVATAAAALAGFMTRWSGPAD